MSQKSKFLGTLIVLFIFPSCIFLSGCIYERDTQETYNTSLEATEYEGKQLTPISEQRNNAIEGTQYIDQDTYELQVYGMVNSSLDLSYEQLVNYPSTTRFTRLDCVEGWGFDAIWTGVPLSLIFEEAQVSDNATNVIFYCADGYSTSLELDYIVENDIMLAYKLNNVTLPPERGFPVQLVAEGKYGYKWAKWITAIELTDEPYEGYWERVGYSNNAEVGGPAFE
ncbi:molybdopterin-dependent oxidoreductase [Methanolobus halotolerans]|uniref:Oxidoreductase n=1 Tax=Methanolobus halotolerans TaxID=2052935 RepID=A0A4E0PVU1_9EURY|nr:molybdopterin-dependent oxidoreductase [Methanolobus halotolerans]TGC09478.1 oxidoreductase [Methanolobus halotolerans]